MMTSDEVLRRHEQVRRVKEAAQSALLQRPNVTGVDVSYKVVGGQRTETLSITVLVKHKTSTIDPEDYIPEDIHGIPTDVVEGGIEWSTAARQTAPNPVDAPDTARYAVLIGGINIGLCPPGASSGYTGTLGIIVSDVNSGNYMLLTNQHVIFPPNYFTSTLAVAQPSYGVSGNCDQVATTGNRLIRDNVVYNGTQYWVDCAALPLNGARQAQGRQIADIGPIYGWRDLTPTDVYACPSVHIRSQVSRQWQGTLLGIDATFTTDVGGKKVEVNNQIRFGTPDNKPAAGDSGSVLVLNQLAPQPPAVVVGLLWGGGSFSHGSGLGGACHIGPVLSALNVTI